MFDALPLLQPPLPTAVGWLICVALGCFFAALVSGMVYLVRRRVRLHASCEGACYPCAPAPGVS